MTSYGFKESSMVFCDNVAPEGVGMADKFVFCELWASFFFSFSLSAFLPDSLLFSQLNTDLFYCVFN